MLPDLGELGKLFTSNHLASADSPFSLITISFSHKTKAAIFYSKKKRIPLLQLNNQKKHTIPKSNYLTI